ncbi:MAG: hypothetical protein K2Y23_10430 [Cyanobacteria bacterium]|nr:hypothetical protein [Cyanobacteriota bacterium]
MKFFRVGSCLAVLMAGAACSQTPQALTGPTAAAGGATAATAAADGSTLKVTAPALISPVDSQRAEDRRPTLIWLNSSGKYGGIGVAYDIELSTPTTVVYSRTVGESPDVGAHLIDMELEYDTVYSWRARAHIGNPDTYGPWSAWASFLSPTRPVAVVPVGNTIAGGCAAPISPLGPGETRKPRPNDSAIVRAVNSQFPTLLARSCQDAGGTWEFMDRSVDALRAKDGRYGYNCKRGNCNDPSVDVISYYWGGGNNIQGSNQVYIFDLIAGHCGPTPSVIWNDVTDITYSSGTEGRTTYPRPGRVVGPCTP